jgi:hypothetical protein
MPKKLRIDLTDYWPFLEVLRDRLNKDGMYTMTLTDAAKIAIERSMESLAPDVKITKTRKKYIRLEF